MLQNYIVCSYQFSLKAEIGTNISINDVDENKPAGSIKLRIETIDYFLKRYQAQMANENQVLTELA